MPAYRPDPNGSTVRVPTFGPGNEALSCTEDETVTHDSGIAFLFWLRYNKHWRDTCLISGNRQNRQISETSYKDTDYDENIFKIFKNQIHFICGTL